MRKLSASGVFALIAFACCIPAANWLISNFGTVCVPQGPCLIPVGFGLTAPSGVLMVGLALVLRDAVHELLGTVAAMLAVALGAVLSMLLAPPSLAFASVIAFVVAEGLDLAVYTPLRERGKARAVLASGAVGSVADSVLFVWLAFGSLEFAAGTVLAKTYASLAVSAIIFARSKCWLGHAWRVEVGGETDHCARCGAWGESDNTRV